MYEVDDEHLLIVTSDRISAFDVVLPTPVPGKGAVLTKLSKFWFGRIECPNHLAPLAVTDVVSAEEAECLDGRALVVRKLEAIPIEATGLLPLGMFPILGVLDAPIRFTGWKHRLLNPFLQVQPQ